MVEMGWDVGVPGFWENPTVWAQCSVTSDAPSQDEIWLRGLGGLLFSTLPGTFHRVSVAGLDSRAYSTGRVSRTGALMTKVL